MTTDTYHRYLQYETGEIILQLFCLMLLSSHRPLVTVRDPLENESPPKVTVLRIQMNMGEEGKVDWVGKLLNWLQYRV